MNSTFSLCKIDEINLKKYGVIFKNYRPKIKRLLEILLSLDELKKSRIFSPEISKIRFDISFCCDDTIREINKDYRGKDKATDVITFSLYCDDEDALVYRKTADLGEIIVSVETAQRQKKETLEKEILTLICHGILHLFGFDHLKKKDYDFVVRIQNLVLGEL